jgi:hypothetical protein
MRRLSTAGPVGLLLLTAACGPPVSERPPAEPPPAPVATGVEAPAVDPETREAPVDDHPPVHQAPHGGRLVALGDHVAHLELVTDASAGDVTLHVLDGQAERPIRIAPEAITVVITAGGETFAVSLTATADAPGGEASGGAAQFSARVPALVGVSRVDARVESVTVRGQTFDNVRF